MAEGITVDSDDSRGSEENGNPGGIDEFRGAMDGGNSFGVGDEGYGDPVRVVWLW